MLSYIIVFIVLSFFGWIYEYIFFHKDSPHHMLPIYGVGGIIVLFISKLQISTFLKILLSSILVCLMECVAGLMSLKINGYHTWQYTNCSTCKGYLSIYSGLLWVVLITIYFKGVVPVINSFN